MNQTPKLKDLLNKGHEIGLLGVETELVHANYDTPMFVFKATVSTEKGTWSAYGDASPRNTNNMIAPHMLRFAESRAIARALRWATNTGEAAAEEMGEQIEEAPGPNGQGGG